MSVYQQSYQGHERAQHYARRADLVIPRRQEILSLIVELLPFGHDDAIRVLDLGSGIGAPAEQVLQHFPRATVLCVDRSSEMLAICQDNLSEYGGRVAFLEADLAQPAWNASLSRPFDAIVSSLTLNLVPHEAKQRLYTQCHEMIRPGGWLVLSDRIRGSSDAVDRLYFDHWMHFIVRQAREVLGKEVPLATVIERQRSMDEAAGVKPATLRDHLRWMEEAGFADVDCPWKYYHLAVLTGRKRR